MIEGLVLLLVFQLLGNVAEMYFHLPVPGSVLGMFLLLIALIANDWLASWVRPISLVLISYLAVLFVPAGVGIMLHIDRLKNEALPIGVSLIVSTILTIAVTALVIKYSTIWLQKRKKQTEARHE
ncbi:CidA/LrgA family protein [Parasutterella excrementihominis]|uniref:CidA/LrgA family protein n=1 Tax=Parasutterella excrementihominis TaxID=487175 RepID=UPI0024309B52|nr:CidA/LrgA family protein [Parasutterella excrementihominis]